MINFTKIYLPILAILVISFQGWSQDCKKYYKDQLENGSKLIECDGNYTIEKTEDGAYILKYYYPETKAITQFITFKDSRLKTLHGKYEKKWDDGTIIESGVYADDKRVGQWTEGNSMGQYSNGLKQGQWKSFQNDTTLLSIQHYKNDILDGEKVKYDSLGQIIETTIYNNGTIINTTADTSKNHLKEAPRFPGCENESWSVKEKEDCAKNKLLEFIYMRLRYPASAREKRIEGKVMLEFVVDKDGSLQDIKVLNGVCKDIKNETLRVLASMPKWRPGYKDGKAVRVKYSLPISFKLE